MITSILQNGQEVLVYGWNHQTSPFFLSQKNGPAQKTELSLGNATFSCPITLQVGSPFVLKQTGESFVVTSARINLHQAQKS